MLYVSDISEINKGYVTVTDTEDNTSEKVNVQTVIDNSAKLGIKGVGTDGMVYSLRPVDEENVVYTDEVLCKFDIQPLFITAYDITGFNTDTEVAQWGEDYDDNTKRTIPYFVIGVPTKDGYDYCVVRNFYYTLKSNFKGLPDFKIGSDAEFRFGKLLNRHTVSFLFDKKLIKRLSKLEHKYSGDENKLLDFYWCLEETMKLGIYECIYNQKLLQDYLKKNYDLIDGVFDYETCEDIKLFYDIPVFNVFSANNTDSIMFSYTRDIVDGNFRLYHPDIRPISVIPSNRDDDNLYTTVYDIVDKDFCSIAPHLLNYEEETDKGYWHLLDNYVERKVGTYSGLTLWDLSEGTEVLTYYKDKLTGDMGFFDFVDSFDLRFDFDKKYYSDIFRFKKNKDDEVCITDLVGSLKGITNELISTEAYDNLKETLNSIDTQDDSILLVTPYGVSIMRKKALLSHYAPTPKFTSEVSQFISKGKLLGKKYKAQMICDILYINDCNMSGNKNIIDLTRITEMRACEYVFRHSFRAQMNYFQWGASEVAYTNLDDFIIKIPENCGEFRFECPVEKRMTVVSNTNSIKTAESLGYSLTAQNVCSVKFENTAVIPYYLYGVFKNIKDNEKAFREAFELAKSYSSKFIGYVMLLNEILLILNRYIEYFEGVSEIKGYEEVVKTGLFYCYQIYFFFGIYDYSLTTDTCIAIDNFFEILEDLKTKSMVFEKLLTEVDTELKDKDGMYKKIF